MSKKRAAPKTPTQLSLVPDGRGVIGLEAVSAGPGTVATAQVASGMGATLYAPPRSYVRMVRSNLKGGVSCELAGKTLLVGKNGTGKSAVINSVELALTGRVSDVSGRATVAKEANLLSMAPGREGTLQAVVMLSDGTQFSWTAEGKEGRAKKANHGMQTPAGAATPPPAETFFPLWALREAVLGAADTARKLFLRETVGTITPEDVLNRLPTTMHPAFLKLAETAADPLAGLLQGEAEAGRRKREAMATARVSAEVVAQGTAGLPSYTAEQLAEAAGMVTSIRQALEQAIQADAARQTVSHATLPYHQPANVPPEYLTARDFLRWCVSQALHVCAACGSGVQSPHVFAARLQAVQAEIDRLALPPVPASRIELPPAAPPDPHIDSLRGQLHRAEAHLNDLQAVTVKWESFRRAKDMAAAAERDAHEWDALGKACRKVVGELLDSAVDSFVARVQRYLPATDRFGLQLRDGSREVCEFGLLSGEVLRTALSGSEWSRVTAALAAALSEKAPYAILVPEDRAFDPDTLSAVLLALENYPGQVLLATTTYPTQVGKVWKVIDTDNGQHRQA